MRVLTVDDKPFHEIEYENVTPGRHIVTACLPVLRATVDQLPDGIGAIVAAADLQGREVRARAKGQPRLLGELLAEELEVLTGLGVLPPAKQVGIMLGGDMYARPDLERRGGSGDVRTVWLAFARRHRWVAGVAGNHDVFGPGPSVPAFQAFLLTPGVHFLDGSTVVVDGLRIGGISGIVGNPRKPYRRDEQQFAAAVNELVSLAPDLLVMHDGPDVAGTNLRGWPSVREALEASCPTLVIRGHAHWENPLAMLANGTQVLNVDSRVVVLLRSRSSRKPHLR